MDKKRPAVEPGDPTMKRQRRVAASAGSGPGSDSALTNRHGYRYTPAEPDPHWIDGWRVAVDDQVLLSTQDRALQLQVSSDRLSVAGEKGYASVMANHGVRAGRYYFEATVVSLPTANSALRLGVCQRSLNVQTPVGVDDFSYCYRSRQGTKFHRAKGTPYGKPFGAGDVVGVLIDLPEENGITEKPWLASTRDIEADYRPRKFDYRGTPFYEEKERPGKKAPAEPLAGGSLEFFLNGESQGVAFEGLSRGEYFPCVSLYMGATASLNFTPSHIPTPTSTPTAVYGARAHAHLTQQIVSDIVTLVDLRLNPPTAVDCYYLGLPAPPLPVPAASAASTAHPSAIDQPTEPTPLLLPDIFNTATTSITDTSEQQQQQQHQQQHQQQQQQQQQHTELFLAQLSSHTDTPMQPTLSTEHQQYIQEQQQQQQQQQEQLQQEQQQLQQQAQSVALQSIVTDSASPAFQPGPSISDVMRDLLS